MTAFCGDGASRLEYNESLLYLGCETLSIAFAVVKIAFAIALPPVIAAEAPSNTEFTIVGFETGMFYSSFNDIFKQPDSV
jgi:hypothetical protein